LLSNPLNYDKIMNKYMFYNIVVNLDACLLIMLYSVRFDVRKV